MEIKSGSRFFSIPGNQLKFADPKLTDHVSKSILKIDVPETVESLQMMPQMFFVSYLNNKQHQMMKLKHHS